MQQYNIWRVCVATSRTHIKCYAAASPQSNFIILSFKFKDFNKEPTS